MEMKMDISFDRIFEVAPPTVLLYPDTPKFTVISANKAYLDATHAKPEDLIGKGFLNAFPESASASVSTHLKMLKDSIVKAVFTKQEQVLPSQKFAIPVWGTNRFNTRYGRVISSPVVDSCGEVQYIVHMNVDITEAVASALKERFVFEVAEERRRTLLEMEERLRLAVESAEMGTWHINLATREFTSSPRMKALFGYNADEELSFNDAIARIPSDQKDRVAQSIDAALSVGLPLNIEYPVTGYHDKKLRWVRATGKRFGEEGGHNAYFSGTVMDITEKKLEELRKNDFLSIASHELKTPITSLKASLQLLSRLKDNPSSLMLPKLIDQCNKSMDKIASLVDDLLNVSRISEGKIELNISRFNVADLIDEACEHVRSAGTHQIMVEGDTYLNVSADQDRINQVLVNLINNAVKYAAGSTKIVIRIEEEPSAAKISVTDFGPGISKSHLGQLFERYYRADTTGVQGSGLGLGLYISAEIIKKHCGDMGVESELGKGSKFWFTLPLKST
jgi:PAS domain S-box-containing protein